MTAPVEWQAPRELLMYGPELGGPTGVSIRYLRADLTCGECARLEIRHSDYFGTVHLCVGRIPTMELRKNTDPACMAFKEKK